MYRKAIIDRFTETLGPTEKSEFQKRIALIVWDDLENPDFCSGRALSHALKDSPVAHLGEEFSQRVLEFTKVKDIKDLQKYLQLMP